MPKLPLIDKSQVVLFLSPRYLLYSASMCIDTIRLCNREDPTSPLSIRLASAAGGKVPASNGISLSTTKIDPKENAGTILVLTSYEPEAACTTEVLNWIRLQSQRGARMACIETAAYVFARSGLVAYAGGEDKATGEEQLAAHYEATPAFREQFGDHFSLDRLFTRRGGIYSSAGAMSTLDLMLNLVEDLKGRALANKVAYVFNHQRADSSQCKPSRADGIINKVDSRLGKIVTLMEKSIGSPRPLDDIYRQSGVEASTARRMFHRLLGQSPKQYYRQLRIEYGREMLLNSDLGITQIADATGYSDASSFSRAYRAVFNVSPGRVRSTEDY